MTALSIPGVLEAYRAQSDAIRQALFQVLDRGQYVLGPEVEAFEQEFARAMGVPEAAGVASGTDALMLALRAAGIGRGDGVLTVSLTAVATVAAIELLGAVPVFVDVSPRRYTLDPSSLERTIQACQKKLEIKAVLPVHLYGQPADMPAIKAVAQSHKMVVVEDCAQAHGAEIGARKVGSWGDAGAFSFYPTKNLGAFGDAGAVISRDPRMVRQVRLLRQYGWEEPHVSKMPGMNSRLDEIQAAILRVRLPLLEASNARRREIARRYDECLARAALQLPEQIPNTSPVFHQYVVRLQERDAFRQRLAALGVPTAVHYPVPVHQQPAYAGRLAMDPAGLAETEAISQEICSLPMSPFLSDVAMDEICHRIVDALSFSQVA